MKKALLAFAAVALLAMFSSEVMAKPANGDSKKKASTSSSGYNDPYKDGEVNINAGIGFGVAGMYGDMVVPPLSLSVEYNTTSVNKLPLSFGGVIGYTSSEEKYSYYYNYKWEYSYLIIGARASYHWNKYYKVSNLDIYTGILLGYNKVTAKWTSDYEGDTYDVSGGGASYLIYGGHAGLRYFFNKNVGVFLEAGYGIGYITAGVTVKM